jgi:hypothetical protein
MKLHEILAAADTHGVTVHCERCWRGVSMTVPMLIEVYGPDREEPRAATRFTCGGCGKPATDFTWVCRPKPHPGWGRMKLGA